MAKTPRKPVKRKAAKPERSASASGNRKLSPRKGAKPVKKAAAKKASPKKAPAKKVVKKAAPKKAAPKKAAKPVKAAKAAPKKAAKPVKATRPAPAKKVAPPKKAAAPAPAPVKKAVKAVKPEKAEKTAKAEKPPKVEKPAKPEKAPRAEKPVKAPKVEAPAKEAKIAAPEPVDVDDADALPDFDGEIPDDLNLEAIMGEVDAAPVLRPGALMGAPKKRGRKRRDPLDDLLKPEKKKRGRPGRPRKRGGLAELMPKRPSRLKRRKGRRSEDDDADIPVAPRPPAPRDSMPLEQIRADVLARYLLGETPACPVGCGGMAQVVRVSTADNGAGEVWLECLSCAQRERFEVAAPTAEERDKVYATLDAGNEPQCTRHSGRYVPLRRRGRDLVCPECGILIPGR